MEGVPRGNLFRSEELATVCDRDRVLLGELIGELVGEDKERLLQCTAGGGWALARVSR